MTWQDRLIQEHKELVERLYKLRVFIDVVDGQGIRNPTDEFKALPEDDQEDLLEQLQHMEGYEDVLSRRISRLAPDHA